MSDPAEEAERTRQAFGLESWARKQPPGPNDPARVLRVHFDGTQPGLNTYFLARLPLNLAHPGALVRIGVKNGGRWVSITLGMEAIAQAADDLERGLS